MCSMTNVDVVAEHIAQQQDDTVFICAGTDGQFSPDDVVTAGGNQQAESHDDDLDMGDQAVVSEAMYRSCNGDFHSLLKDSVHYKRMMVAGLKRTLTTV